MLMPVLQYQNVEPSCTERGIYTLLLTLVRCNGASNDDAILT